MELILYYMILYIKNVNHIIDLIESNSREIKKCSGNLELLNFSMVTPCLRRCSKAYMEKSILYAEKILSKFMDNFFIKSCIMVNPSILEDVMSKYFECSLPFELSKRKEFPDALALLSIERWAIDNDMYIICMSNDGGWLKYCNDSERMFCTNDSFLLFREIFKDLIEYNNALDDINKRIQIICSNKNYFMECLSDNIGDKYFHAQYESPYDCDCSIDDVELESYEVKSTDILYFDKKDDTCIVNFSLVLRLNVEYSFELYQYDSFDKDFISLGVESGDNTYNIDSSIEMVFCISHSDLLSIDNVYISDTIDVGLLEY